MNKFLLTFDTEDFVSKNSIPGLLTLLEKLETRNAKALFFITGHMAEKVAENPAVVDMLNVHEIGYHSSGHTVHPTIFEFTDVESYQEAYRISKIRESSHINPLTGEVEGEGGVLALRKVFPKKSVVAFRAPGHCWSPPHSEALRDLGVKYDFSSYISVKPFCHKGITFYPYPTVGDWQGSMKDYYLLYLSILKNKITTAGIHPSLIVNKIEWDSIYWKGNPKQISFSAPRDTEEVELLFKSFDTLIKRVQRFEKIKFLDMSPDFKPLNHDSSITLDEVKNCYQRSIRWPKKFFNYEPKYLYNHFLEFFDMKGADEKAPD
jgi:hypothetical protein